MMPRFVLLFHECPADLAAPGHWDFMLQRDAALRTWRLLELPASWQRGLATFLAADSSIAATRLADHRLAYLDYQGPVSGGRGAVTRVDCGEYRVDFEDDGALRVELFGQNLRGVVELLHGDGDVWRLRVDAGDLGARR